MGPRVSRRPPPGRLTGLADAAVGRRQRLGMTQLELAELADVGVSSVHALEAGSDRLTLAVLMRMLEVLGLELVIGAGDSHVRLAGPPTKAQPRS